MVEIKPQIINIAGDSGSGKSTIANFIRLYYGYENTTIISGDDLHKYDRKNSIWEKYTHLNPLTNDLQKGDDDLKKLKNCESIYRNPYNHTTGMFDNTIEIKPNKYIINEGLHSFYTDYSSNISDLNIWIDTDESNRIKFKLNRDINERGYTEEMVYQQIEQRETDANHIRDIQIKKADVIITMKYLHGFEITLNKKGYDYKLFEFIETMHKELQEFEWMNSSLGHRISIVQSKGGNISSKINEKLMIIKESGGKIKDIKYNKGYSVIDYNINFDDIVSDTDLDSKLLGLVKNTPYKKPSMETAFHTGFKKYVFHIHPIYLNCILSLENGKDIIDSIFLDDDFEYSYLDYYNPGFELSSKILNTPDLKEVIFLQNHGLIVTSDRYLRCIHLISRINTFTKEYIQKAVPNFKEFDFSWPQYKPIETFTFPDAVVIDDEETLAAHNYILWYANKLGKIKPISKDDVDYLLNLQSEKYRK
jgi:uridine kinase